MASAPLAGPSLLSRSMTQLGELARRLGVRRSPQAEPESASSSHGSSTAAEVSPQAPSATQVTFLPRDPQWAFVFWTIDPADRVRAVAAGGQQLCLRVADVTGLPAWGIPSPCPAGAGGAG